MVSPTLSRREREILEVIFAIGDEASAEEIRERLSDPPSYSAVRAMLTKLEAKGAVKHKEKGLRYVYSPTMARGKARKSALRRMVDVFFEGSKEQAVTALLNEERWSDDELDELSKEIERVRSERRKS
ncbi:MAG TPA: BlaI/MecI/CopY family transcriptional regulator [Thermoanaerobaculia bacterium]|jgi:predicted transcriptional regulator|nr:BlaI/MecI/CopY family transcriptional regulator [Thermoanaerobaculia bacterium]